MIDDYEKGVVGKNINRFRSVDINLCYTKRLRRKESRERIHIR
jgi:hypothetical protein